MILSFLGGAYCLGTYALMVPAAKMAFDKEQTIKARIYHGTCFVLSPITVPIGCVFLWITG